MIPPIFIYLLLFLHSSSSKQKHSSFSLKLIDPHVGHPNIFKSGKLTKNYNPSVYLKGTDCTNGNLQIVQFEQAPGDQLIYFQYEGEDIRKEDILISVEPNAEPAPVLFNLNRVYKEIIIDARCPARMDAKNYYNRVIVEILLDKNKSKQFSFLLNCDFMDYHKKFQYGYLFISIICCLIVFFVSFHPRIYSLRIRNVPLNVEIRWGSFLVVLFIVIVCMVAIYFQKLSPKDIHQYSLKSQNLIRMGFSYSFLQHFGLFCSTIFMFICSNQFFFSWPYIVSHLPFLGVKVFGQFFSSRVILSLAISFITYIFSLIFDNWLFYNVLSFFIVIGAIKTVRFRSLRNGVYSMLIITVTIIITTLWAYFSLPRSYNDYATQLSSPLFIEVPDLVDNLYKKCSWISVLDLIFPGAILAYLHDYDENLHNVWHKGVYTYVAMISYLTGNMIWVIFEALSKESVPYCVIVYPFFLGGIILMGLYRNQFKTIWYGRFHYSLDLTALEIIQKYKSGNPAKLEQILESNAFEQMKINLSEQSSLLSVSSKQS